MASGQAFPYGIAIDASNVYWVTWSNGGGIYGAPKTGGSVVTLASGLKSPFEVTYAAGVVYASVETNGTIVSSSVSAPMGSTFASGQKKPGAIAADASGVYWINRTGDTVHGVPLAGGTPTQLTSGANLRGLALDASYVYYLSASELLRVPKP